LQDLSDGTSTRGGSKFNAATVISAIILVGAALYFAASVFAPLAFALLIIAIVWPMQKHLQTFMPQVAAVCVTILATIAVLMEFASLISWSFGRVGRYFLSNGSSFQLVYGQLAEWLQGHGIAVAGLWAEHFNAGWLARVLQEITIRMSGALTFSIVMLTYVILGLLEVDSLGAKLRALPEGEIGRDMLEGAVKAGERTRMYMLVRTLMSVVTGLLVWGFASAIGLELALEWGVIAFVLNYVPFIGPFVATVLPTAATIAQYGSWRMAIVIFACLNLIQFLVGSYLEPRITGRALAISPFMVLFAVFFWTFMWGIDGAFIGVPILIAAVTLCEQHAFSRWIAQLLAGFGSRQADTSRDGNAL
jgi:AI-2 transport protein TqsA